MTSQSVYSLDKKLTDFCYSYHSLYFLVWSLLVFVEQNFLNSLYYQIYWNFK